MTSALRAGHIQACALACYYGRDWDGGPDIDAIRDYEADHEVTFTREEMVEVVTTCNRMCTEQPPATVGQGTFTPETAQLCIDQLNQALDESDAQEA